MLLCPIRLLWRYLCGKFTEILNHYASKCCRSWNNKQQPMQLILFFEILDYSWLFIWYSWLLTWKKWDIWSEKQTLKRCSQVRAYNTRLQLCFYDPRNLIKEKLTVQGDFYTHTLPWKGVTIKILSKLKKVSSVLLSFLRKSSIMKDMNKQLWAQS